MYIFKDLSKKKKPFNLKKLKSIKSMKGFSKLFLKFDLEENFIEYSVLDNKFELEVENSIKNSESILSKLEKQLKPVGIKAVKHKNLIRDTKNFCTTYKEFYENLKISNH